MHSRVITWILIWPNSMRKKCKKMRSNHRFYLWRELLFIMALCRERLIFRSDGMLALMCQLEWLRFTKWGGRETHRASMGRESVQAQPKRNDNNMSEMNEMGGLAWRWTRTHSFRQSMKMWQLFRSDRLSVDKLSGHSNGIQMENQPGNEVRFIPRNIFESIDRQNSLKMKRKIVISFDISDIWWRSVKLPPQLFENNFPYSVQSVFPVATRKMTTFPLPAYGRLEESLSTYLNKKILHSSGQAARSFSTARKWYFPIRAWLLQYKNIVGNDEISSKKFATEFWRGNECSDSADLLPTND